MSTTRTKTGRPNRSKPRSAPIGGTSSLSGMGQIQTMPGDASSVPLLPLDTIRIWMAEGRYAAAMEENAKLRQRLDALDCLIAYVAPLLRDEDGYRA